MAKESCFIGAYVLRLSQCVVVFSVFLLLTILPLPQIDAGTTGEGNGAPEIPLSQELKVPGINLHVPNEMDPLALAYDCLMSLALQVQGVPGALERAIKSGEHLVRVMSIDKAGKAGWSYTRLPTKASSKCGKPGSLDAFSDGTCNPPETPYMIQTGYAMAALAQLTLVTGEKRFLDSAVKAAEDSWNFGIVPKGCSDCFFYWYSYHPNDYGRYVRNTNLIMALGLAWLYVATGNESYRERVLAITRDEVYEVRLGNFGYYGVNDRRYPTNLASNDRHVVHQIKALKDIAILLNQPQLLDSAERLLDSFLESKQWKEDLSTKATMAIAPCVLGDCSNRYAVQCGAARTTIGKLNTFQVIAAEPRSIIEKLAASRATGKQEKK